MKKREKTEKSLNQYKVGTAATKGAIGASFALGFLNDPVDTAVHGGKFLTSFYDFTAWPLSVILGLVGNTFGALGNASQSGIITAFTVVAAGGTANAAWNYYNQTRPLKDAFKKKHSYIPKSINDLLLRGTVFGLSAATLALLLIKPETAESIPSFINEIRSSNDARTILGAGYMVGFFAPHWVHKLITLPIDTFAEAVKYIGLARNWKHNPPAMARNTLRAAWETTRNHGKTALTFAAGLVGLVAGMQTAYSFAYEADTVPNLMVDTAIFGQGYINQSADTVLTAFRHAGELFDSTVISPLSQWVSDGKLGNPDIRPTQRVLLFIGGIGGAAGLGALGNVLGRFVFPKKGKAIHYEKMHWQGPPTPVNK